MCHVDCKNSRQQVQGAGAGVEVEAKVDEALKALGDAQVLVGSPGNLITAMSATSARVVNTVGAVNACSLAARPEHSLLSCLL